MVQPKKTRLRLSLNGAVTCSAGQCRLKPLRREDATDLDDEPETTTFPVPGFEIRGLYKTGSHPTATATESNQKCSGDKGDDGDDTQRRDKIRMECTLQSFGRDVRLKPSMVQFIQDVNRSAEAVSDTSTNPDVTSTDDDLSSASDEGLPDILFLYVPLADVPKCE